MCEWGKNKPWLWAKDVAHLWRTTYDIHDQWEPEKVGSPNGVKPILDLQVGLEKFAGPGHWNDPDMLEVGNPGLSLAESRAHFSLWCMLAAPLMAGNDVRKMTPEIRDILTNADVIAIDQDSLGKQGYRVWSGEGYEIWIKGLRDGDRAVCVLNTGPEREEIEFDWNKVDALGGKYSIRDPWDKKDAGTTDAPFRHKIDSHDVVLLRMSPVKSKELSSISDFELCNEGLEFLHTVEVVPKTIESPAIGHAAESLETQQVSLLITFLSRIALKPAPEPMTRSVIGFGSGRGGWTDPTPPP
jgi:alpha-galactosidase